jgi:hypothetical protein
MLCKDRKRTRKVTVLFHAPDSASGRVAAQFRGVPAFENAAWETQ